jgi:GDP-L-fucose synthase
MTELRGRSILVTGGAGFLGRAVVEQLQGHGADVVIVRSRDFDLTRQTSAETLISELKPKVVIHLAAEVGGIGANRENPGRYFYANAMMGLNLIEAARVAGVRKFVQVGTVCAYPKHAQVPFREADLWSGYPEETNAPYGIAKKALAVMLDGYRRQYGFNGIYLLPANLYGPGDNFDPATSHVIPALVRKFVDAVASRRAEVEVWGTGAATREFLHVKDAARAIVLATARYDGPEPVNIGNGQETTIKGLVELIGKKVGFEGEVVWNTAKPDGQPRRSLDTSRAEKLFDFQAEVPLSAGLDETIEWWRQHRGDS